MLVESAVTALILFALDRMGGKSGSPAASRHPASPSSPSGRPLALPTFSDEQAAKLTQQASSGRAFAPGLLPGLRRELACRSARPVAVQGLSGWEVCPLRGDLDLASDVVERVTARGQVAVASLTLVLSKADPHVPVLLLSVSESAAPGLTAAGPFAVLAAPAPRVEQSDPQPAAAAPVDQQVAQTVTPEPTPVVSDASTAARDEGGRMMIPVSLRPGVPIAPRCARSFPVALPERSVLTSIDVPSTVSPFFDVSVAPPDGEKVVITATNKDDRARHLFVTVWFGQMAER